jgi:polyphosphate kinase 2 (PPK2 family)
MLESVDLNLALEKSVYAQELQTLQNELRTLQLQLTEQRRPIMIVYEGWDAAGKGGNITRLTERLDPRFFTVYGIGKPTQEELDHHYLWRFWTKLPARDHLVILDRSWYGRVLVERVEGFATEAEWRRAYGEINTFERLLIEDGTIIIKFWLHISPDEQLMRFERRLQDPAKRWKMNDEDWRNRAKWPEYEAAVEDMLQETHTDIAPWVVVEGNDKRWARIKGLRTVVERFRAEVRIDRDDAQALTPST